VLGSPGDKERDRMARELETQAGTVIKAVGLTLSLGGLVM
jgi:hypothetical protein